MQVPRYNYDAARPGANGSAKECSAVSGMVSTESECFAESVGVSQHSDATCMYASQFYNDFLVANVFLGVYNPENLVVTSHVSQLAVGAYGEAWHLRTSGAIISMIVPLIVFFSLQRFFIRGLIGGAVKG